MKNKKGSFFDATFWGFIVLTIVGFVVGYTASLLRNEEGPDSNMFFSGNLYHVTVSFENDSTLPIKFWFPYSADEELKIKNEALKGKIKLRLLENKIPFTETSDGSIVLESKKKVIIE